MTIDKTSALKSLLVRAWRERWSDVQWSIHLKDILPRGCAGDVYGLSGLILKQALMSPIPNQLLLSYLNHALASHTVSHASVLDSIANFDAKKLPFCLQSLLDLVQLSLGHVTARGKPEECLTLSVSLLKVCLWLLKLLQCGLTPNQGENAPKNYEKEVQMKNMVKAKNILQSLLDNEFTLSMMFIGRIEEKETFSKIINVCKRVKTLE